MATASSIIAGRALVLIEAVDKSGKVFTKVMARFNNLNKTIERLKSRGMSSIDAYRIALSRLVLPLVGMEKNWTAFGKLTGFVLNTIGMKIKQLGQQSLMLGFQLAAAAAVMFMPLKDSVQEAAKLDTELLKAKAAAELTDEELQNLSKTVKETSRGTTFLSTEIAQVAKNLARAGLKGEQLEAGLLPVLNLARSTDYDPERAAELFVQAITVFDKGVNEYQKVADNFVTAANESVVDMDDLGAAFSYVAGTAESTRFGLTKTLAALAQLSFSGLTGSKGGTSLNQFLETLGQKAEDIEETFGVKAFDISGQMRNPLDLLAELGDVLRALPDEQKLPHLTRIFNVRGARAVKALRTLENLTSMIDKMNTQTGIAAEQAGILDRGFEGSIRRILRSVALLKVELGEAFRKPLEKIANLIERLVDKMIPWFKANHKAVQMFGALVVATIAAAGALITFGITGGAIAGVFAGLAAIAEAVGVAITALGAAGISLGPALAIIAAAIVTIVLGVAGMIFHIKKLIPLIKDTLVAAWGKVSNAFDSLWKTIVKGVHDIWVEVNRLWDSWASVFGDSGRDAINFLSGLLRFWTKIAEIIVQQVLTAIKTGIVLVRTLSSIVKLLLAPFFIIVSLIRKGINLSLNIIILNLRIIQSILIGIGWVIDKLIRIPLAAIQVVVMAIKAALWVLLLPIKTIGLLFQGIWLLLKGIWWVIKTIVRGIIELAKLLMIVPLRQFAGTTRELGKLWENMKKLFSIALEAPIKLFSALMTIVGKILAPIGKLIGYFLTASQIMNIVNIALTLINAGLELMIIGFEALADVIIKPFEDMIKMMDEANKAFKDFVNQHPLLKRLMENMGLIEYKEPEKPNPIQEKMDLLRRKSQLGMELGNTVTASSITMEAGSVADREATFRDRQQESVLNELRRIEDRLRVIESQQRNPDLSLGGI